MFLFKKKAPVSLGTVGDVLKRAESTCLIKFDWQGEGEFINIARPSKMLREYTEEFYQQMVSSVRKNGEYLEIVILG